MGQVNSRWRRTTEGYSHWCPGCLEMHHIRTDGERKPRWGFDGNIDCPTFTPSVKITGVQAVMVRGEWTGEFVRGPDGKALDHCCHYFLTAGKLLFLADCTHPLKGQTVPVPDLPPWAVDHREETETMADQDPSLSEPNNDPAALPADAVGQADAPPPAADPAVLGAAGTAEQPEPAAAPLETAQDQGQQAGDQAEKPQEDAGKNVQTMTLAFDAEQIAALTAELKGHLDDGFTAIKAEFAQKMDELAEHCEKRIDSLSEVVDAADIGAIKILVDDAKQAVESIRNSGAAGLADRLAKLEMQLRHSL